MSVGMNTWYTVGANIIILAVACDSFQSQMIPWEHKFDIKIIVCVNPGSDCLCIIFHLNSFNTINLEKQKS